MHVAGDLKAVLTIDGVRNVDWEDIACSPCYGGGGYCIHVADTGGNTRHDANTIYRIKEPTRTHTQTLSVDSTIKFRYFSLPLSLSLSLSLSLQFSLCF